MSAISLPARQWYDTTWLVIFLCIVFFPVGLYGLWKSGRFSTMWKIAGTSLVAVAIIAVAATNGEPASEVTTASAEPEKNSEPIATAVKSNSVLFSTTEEFTSAFNKFTSSNSIDLSIVKTVLKEGSVNNTFSSTINSNLMLVGTLNKADGTVKDVMMIGAGDGTATSGGNIIFCMGAIIAAVDPTLSGDERIDVLKKLGLFSDADVLNLSGSTDLNGNHYFISSSEVTGIMFGASKSDQ